MIIKTLSENTSISKDIASEHGLSLYIKTKKHKILFDVGASELFLNNAKKLDVNISDVDFLVISHGHFDHGGGLKVFLRENTNAEVFIHRQAFEKYYARRSNDKLEFIGLDESLKENKQLIATSERFFISKGIQVFSNVIQKEPLAESNNGLLMEQKGEMTDDAFLHEQNLILDEDEKSLLVTGCAHNGIINILEHFYALKGHMPDYVIGGFHLSSHSNGNESFNTIDKISKYLMDTKAKFYTCHCTGIEAYERLKHTMGDRIEYLSAGSKMTLNK